MGLWPTQGAHNRCTCPLIQRAYSGFSTERNRRDLENVSVVSIASRHFHRGLAVIEAVLADISKAKSSSRK